MASYEGTIVQNDHYKTRKLEQQVRAERDKLTALQGLYDALNEKYTTETADLKAHIKRLQEVKPKTRKLAKPARKKETK